MKYFINIIVCLIPIVVYGQPSSSIDFGIGTGISSYYGDINQNVTFYNPKLAVDGFIRYNFNSRFAIRGNLMTTRFEANDKDFDNDYQQRRNASFDRNVIEAGIIGEVNFFPYINPTEWGFRIQTIYGLVGAGYATSYSNSDENLNIPNVMMGIGYKRVIGNRFAVEAEYCFRKLYNDALDGISDPIKSGVNSRLFNNDWYNIFSIRLSYNFWHQSGKCRTFEKDTDL